MTGSPTTTREVSVVVPVRIFGDDGQWGTLLDNLHVAPEAQRRGWRRAARRGGEMGSGPRSGCWVVSVGTGTEPQCPQVLRAAQRLGCGRRHLELSGRRERGPAALCLARSRAIVRWCAQLWRGGEAVLGARASGSMGRRGQTMAPRKPDDHLLRTGGRRRHGSVAEVRAELLQGRQVRKRYAAPVATQNRLDEDGADRPQRWTVVREPRALRMWHGQDKLTEADARNDVLQKIERRCGHASANARGAHDRDLQLSATSRRRHAAHFVKKRDAGLVEPVDIDPGPSRAGVAEEVDSRHRTGLQDQLYGRGCHQTSKSAIGERPSKKASAGSDTSRARQGSGGATDSRVSVPVLSGRLLPGMRTVLPARGESRAAPFLGARAATAVSNSPRKCRTSNTVPPSWSPAAPVAYPLDARRNRGLARAAGVVVVRSPRRGCVRHVQPRLRNSMRERQSACFDCC